MTKNKPTNNASLEESNVGKTEFDTDKESWRVIHSIACEQKKASYIDPLSGYTVFTEFYHLQRGRCCGSGCRHCPYKK